MSEGVDYIVLGYPLPHTINGFVCRRIEDDMPVIVINENLSEQRRLIALEHELIHLEHDDLYQLEKPVYKIEKEVNNGH